MLSLLPEGFANSMVAFLLPNGKQQFIDINGKPLVAGTVGMYVPSTLIFKNTWQDAGQAVLNTNPIVLDSRGQAVIYGTGPYRQIVKDASGNLIWDKPVQGVGGADGIVSVVANIAALRALAVAGTDLTPIFVEGYYTSGDGGGGAFVWESANVSADNGGTIIQVTGVTTGRYVRPNSGALFTVNQFGAKGDDSTENSTSFNNAMTACGVVGIIPGTYRLKNCKIPYGAGLIGQDQKTVILKGTADATNILKTDNINNSGVYVNYIELRNFTYDMTLMTDSSSNSAIYFTTSYENSISNIRYIDESSFPTSAWGLNFDGSVYDTSIVDCYFPFWRAVGNSNDFNTTIRAIGLNTYGCTVGYFNGYLFEGVIFQKDYDKITWEQSGGILTIIGGDVEQSGYYLRSNGHFVSQVTSLNNALGGFTGIYLDDITNFASCYLMDRYSFYGFRTVTSITRSSSTATVTLPAPHGLVTNDRVQIFQANQTEYNGFFVITVTGANTFTYTVSGTPASPATGTILYGPDWSGNGATWFPFGQLNGYYTRAADRWVWGNTQFTSSTVLMTGLPTADPHFVGQLWNNAGVLTVSAG